MSPTASASQSTPGAIDALSPIGLASMAAMRSRPETFLGAYSELGGSTSSAAFLRS